MNFKIYSKENFELICTNRQYLPFFVFRNKIYYLVLPSFNENVGTVCVIFHGLFTYPQSFVKGGLVASLLVFSIIFENNNLCWI